MTPNNYIYLLKEFFYQKMDSDNTLQMRGYMKEQFEFFGIKSPERKEIVKYFLNNLTALKYFYIATAIKKYLCFASCSLYLFLATK
ncbi:MAG: hypothetical protein DRI95_09875 [Bacteroidetes bacterium]|nr:MAG: hypothetical protein DRI95_09875 [Bacteroidota bacterium]